MLDLANFSYQLRSEHASTSHRDEVVIASPRLASPTANRMWIL